MPSDGDRARALLAYANYAKVGVALRVSRATVADWAKGQSVTPYRLNQLEQLLRPDLQTKEAAPPQWVERLMAGVMALETKADVSDAELVAAEARAAIYLAANTRKRPRLARGGGGSASNA